MQREELRSTSEALNIQIGRGPKARYESPRLGGKLPLEAVTHFECDAPAPADGPKPVGR
jgi:hypothetical protein